MTFDLVFFALAIPAVLFAGISKGGFGSGAAFASSAILALVFPPGVAIGVMLPLLMLMDAGGLRAYWGKWDWRLSGIIILGTIPGLALGGVLYRVADPNLFRLLLGVISIAFVLWQLVNQYGWIRRRLRAMSPVAGLIAGAFGGFTSFISHAGGPPVAVYLLSHPLSKTAFQASTVLIFTFINAAKVIPYAFLGIFTRETWIAGLYLAPFALLGVWLGVKAHDMISEKLFFTLTYVMLTITGCKLIWDALV